MFRWFKKKPEPQQPQEQAAHQPPGEVFPWPKRWRITAVDEAVIAIPAAVLEGNDVIGAVIHCDDEVRLNLPTEISPGPDARIEIWLKPGQWIWLTKSCQAMILAQVEGDNKPRRFTLLELK